MPTKVTSGEVIEILNNDEKEPMEKYEREEVMTKVEPD